MPARLRQESDQWVVERAQAGRGHRLREHGLDRTLEPHPLAILAREGSDDAHARQALFRLGRELTDALLHLLQRRPGNEAVAPRDPHHERHRQQRLERERGLMTSIAAADSTIVSADWIMKMSPYPRKNRTEARSTVERDISCPVRLPSK